MVFFFYHIPTAVVSLLSKSISITLSFSSLLLITVFLSLCAYFVVRYRYLSVYSRLTDDPKPNEAIEMMLDPKLQSQARPSGYLDEFLAAIKVFGNLDKQVSHALTKNMTTQRLDADEVLFLDDRLGFAVLMEGHMLVYSKRSAPRQSSKRDANILTLNCQTYQLLNQVKSGNPLSSLFGILTLFTQFGTVRSGLQSPMSSGGSPRPSLFRTYTDMAQSGPEDLSPGNPELPSDVYPDIIAKATTDCTIAIIPADAFRRLFLNHPKASAQIVQMILTRLHRVTMQTAHNYLGLTAEIYETEARLNSSGAFQLPSYLHNSVVQKFDRLHGSSSDLFKQSTSPPASRIASPHFETDVIPRGPPKVFAPNKSRPHIRRNQSRHVILGSRKTTNPGDLLSNVPLSRKEFTADVSEKEVRSRMFSADEETEETSLRIAIIEAMLSLLGIKSEHCLLRKGCTGSSTGLMALGNVIGGQVELPFSTVSPAHVKFFIDSASDKEEDELLVFEAITREFAGYLDLVFIRAGTTLIREKETNKGLYFVIDGHLGVSYIDSDGDENYLHSVKAGGLAGYIGTIVGHKSFVSVKATTDAYVGFLSSDRFERLTDKHYILQIPLAKHLVGLFSREILEIDFALEWIHSLAGEMLAQQGDMANGIYVVLNGRFRAIQEDEKGNPSALGEFGQGESLGEIEVLTASKRASSLVAVRDSECARIPRFLFEILAIQHPSIMIKISRIVALRMQSLISPLLHLTVKATHNGNYRTITVLPITDGLPVAEFADKLVTSLKSVNRSVIALNQASTLHHLGRRAFDRLAKIKQTNYLCELEEKFQIVVYVTDTPVSSQWTKTCISQGDCILLLADARAEPSVGAYERLLVKTRATAKTDLILLHPERSVDPGSTMKWLQNRRWIDSHHHVQMAVDHKAVTDALNLRHIQSTTRILSSLNFADLRSKVNLLIKQDIFKISRTRNYYAPAQIHKSDFLRLARILSGQAVGLVLGGGGARGISHVGVIKALEEKGIPIDLIGGTSMGSFVGGLYARDYDLVSIFGRAKKFCGRTSSLWRNLFDLTYPVTSYVTGHEFNRGIWKAFGASRIEDFWISYFTNSTNITNSVMEIHTSGYAWKYIRASMSLAGLLPPITDKGSMLLDGGYLDNLPVVEMQNRGATIIFAVDVGSVDDRTPMTYGDTLNGWWVLFNRWNPFSKHPNVPSMAEVQMRLAYVSSVNALEIAKNTKGIVYLRPPIDNYATLDFGKFDEIYHVGEIYARNQLAKLESNGKLPVIPGVFEGVEELRLRERFQRRNSM
ncbi:hypothetical protein BABINDRAFT_161770 [Babjeviella inositovora NRRL Y-12698]|uniref:Lysophospholipase NTE1 n=1 Tax=Babjeviella inositovora NRRL Y-12698 TaxID=984486 RepID=A0A1E3QPH9_9ASCO|nr:uncharacterized protein BABINDRAFT_161770 [Babjeviella inositovora NRRL Y-12698]ODQ79364.1 hypothetical protein BABINDRAFT_161770 [Babjeviella inositovora NRRL Y-12698]